MTQVNTVEFYDDHVVHEIRWGPNLIAKIGLRLEETACGVEFLPQLSFGPAGAHYVRIGLDEVVTCVWCVVGMRNDRLI